MPPLTVLKPVTWSPALRLAMIALRGYLTIGALLLLIKTTQPRLRMIAADSGRQG